MSPKGSKFKEKKKAQYITFHTDSSLSYIISIKTLNWEEQYTTLLGQQTFLPQQGPNTTTNHNCFETNEREPQKVLKIKRKALTDRFCARPEMTPGTRPRIIFLLVAPAANSATAEKDTRAVGGPDQRWMGREEQDASTQEAALGPFLRFMEAMPLSGFPAKHTLCHPCPDQPLPIRTKHRPRPGQALRHCQAWHSQPFLSKLC